MKRSGTNVSISSIGWLSLAFLVLLNGCASHPGGVRAPEPPARAARSTPAGALAPTVLTGRASVVIDSDPGGAVVVVDGRPIGPSPQSISLPVNGNGFMSRSVSVKVRFVADDANGASQTAEVVLTPLDRAPARLDFTPQGARRTLVSLKGS